MIKLNYRLFLSVTLIVFLIAFIYLFSYRLFSGDDKIIIDKFTLNGQSDDLHYRYLTKAEAGLYRFSSNVDEQDLAQIETGNYKLIIYRLAGQYYRVYFNDTLLGSLGSSNGRSNIWNAIELYEIDKGLIKEENTLILEVLGKYDLGLTSFPIIITTIFQGNGILNWFSLLIANSTNYSFGVLIFVFALLQIFYRLEGRNKREYLYYSLGMLFIAISLINEMVFFELPSSIILFKKLVLLARFIGVFFISFAIGEHFDFRVNKITGYLLFVVFLVLTVFYTDLTLFIKTINLATIFLLLAMISWLYTTWQNRNQSSSKIIFTSVLIILFLVSLDFYNVMFRNMFVISMYIYGLILFAFSIMYVVFMDYVQACTMIAHERERAHQLYQRSIRDGMTGVYNHQYIAATLEKNRIPYALVILDLDNFKEINDSYGHQTGDYVLKELVKTIKKRIRKTDILGRYGGDEFVLILYNCRREEVEKIAHGIKDAVEEPIYNRNGDKIKVTTSMGIYISLEEEDGEDVLNKADRALYLAKNKGKNKIVIFNQI